jgi:hypothetical protein
VKTVHELFPKQFIEETLKKLKAEVEGVKLIAIGYKYHKKHALHFIMSENVGSNKSGDLNPINEKDRINNIKALTESGNHKSVLTPENKAALNKAFMKETSHQWAIP